MQRKANPWMSHVKKVKAANPGMKYSDVLKKAKTSYKKKGGGIVDDIDKGIRSVAKTVKPYVSQKVVSRANKIYGAVKVENYQKEEK